MNNPTETTKKKRAPLTNAELAEIIRPRRHDEEAKIWWDDARALALELQEARERIRYLESALLAERTARLAQAGVETLPQEGDGRFYGSRKRKC